MVTSAPSATELRNAYSGKRVLVTGHTGFKGAWLTVWLQRLGAQVHGYALAPESEKWIFSAAGVASRCQHTVADVRDPARLKQAVQAAQPDFVFHLAAQALVRKSYETPLETLDVNVMGTAHVLEAVRAAGRPCAVVVVTSDKCYENREWLYGYREVDPMGGHDVYSMSKGAAELVVSSWRRSFFPPQRLSSHGIRLASARAGNVIGGGDWAVDRIVPDAIRALAAGSAIPVRNPDSVRPWQHVLEPVGGYLLLGARLSGKEPESFCEAWNFGPRPEATQPVRALADEIVASWGSGRWEDRREAGAQHEAGMLRLSIDKATARLGWAPRWDFKETVHRTVEWYQAQVRGASPQELAPLTEAQIDAFEARSTG